jgi:hypothetical protein
MADISISLDRSYVVDIERQGDVYLMDWIRTKTTFNKRQTNILNCCRLHVHATTISELLDSSGRNFLPHMFNCTRPKWFNKRQFMPIQPRPSNHQIRTLWKPLCKQIKQHISQQLIKMHQWTGKSAHTRPFRSSYVDTSTTPNTHYHWIQDLYWLLKPYLTTVPGYFITDHSTDWKPTTTAIPISITQGRPTINRTVFRLCKANTNHTPPSTRALPNSIHICTNHHSRGIPALP